ncbi:MAG: hypothetical protein EBS19_07605, partial [Spirochaetia bacterium]|nr:hypothetical protein [Spirochaetia bacterium]
THNHAFYGFDIEDIIIINDETFGIITTDYISPLEKEDNTICFWCPFTKPYFSCPEIIQLTKLPSRISYKSCYYSLASIAIYLLWGEYIFKGNISESQIKSLFRS